MKDATPAYWALVALTLAGFAAMGFWSLPLIRAEAGGLPAFDVRPNGYDLADAQAFLAALSPEGLAHYGGLQMQMDAIFPPLLFASLAIALWHLSEGRRQVTRFMLVALPAAGMVFDGLENMRIRAMLIAGPDGVTEALVQAASFFTTMKTASFAVALAALAVLLVTQQRRSG